MKRKKGLFYFSGSNNNAVWKTVTVVCFVQVADHRSARSLLKLYFPIYIRLQQLFLGSNSHNVQIQITVCPW